jgi:PAS domain S-box-containing protein
LDSLRILLVDDHEPVRRGVRSLLSSHADWLVCGEAVDGLDAVEKAKALRPNVVLMDISMPRMNGLDATQILRRDMPDSKIVIVSQNDPAIACRQATEVDAAAYVAKSSLSDDLVPTIEKVISREPKNGSHPMSATAGYAVSSWLPGDAENRLQHLAAIVDSSDDGIISKNLDGIITSWNKAAERLFGYSAEEAVGRHITLIIPCDRRPEEAMILDRLKRGERVEHFETVRVRRDGGLLDVSLTISPVRDSEGRVIGASKIARDITAQKRSEQTLRESEQRLRVLTDTLEAEVRARTMELERRNKEVLHQSEKLRELSHRLIQIQDHERRHIARELHDSAGQILAALGMNLATVVRNAKLNAPELARLAEESEQMVRELSQEIRTTSYLLHPPLLDECGLAESLLWYIRGLKERSGLDVTLAIPDDFRRLTPEMELVIFRIVQECLTNVHRHSGSKVAAIEIKRASENITLSVQDEGSGIPAEKLLQIESQGGGVGIRGMRERVLQFGGEMALQSGPMGAKISVTFPAADLRPSEEVPGAALA